VSGEDNGGAVTPLDLEVNPPGSIDEYLAGVNRCFTGWGGDAEYRWAFVRAVGAPPADLLVLRDGPALVAGSAVVYRTVGTERGDVLVGIMSGSWTLPEARGRGAFSRLIVESQRLVAAHDGAALIAFVTHDNASRRRLVAAGCREVPSHYLFSTADTTGPHAAPAVATTPVDVEALYRAHMAWVEAGRGAHPRYASAAEWAGQYVLRPLPVEHVAVGGCEALIERSPSSDRVLWLVGGDPGAALAGLLDRALRSGRQLFLYSMDDAVVEAANRLGLTDKPGSLTVLDVPGGPGAGAHDAVAGVDELAHRWRIHGGDRA
jgi:hypothetical protein